MSNGSPRKPLKSTQSVPFDARIDETEARGPALPLMLVIAIDETTRRSLVDYYSENQWCVRYVANMQEAIDSALDQQPEVIVLDLFMPNINPRHLVRTLRTAVEHDVRMIGLAATSATVFEEARQAGIDVVFPLPIDLAAVDAFLAMKRV